MPDGETRLIAERITKLYGDPLNSLHVGEKTRLLDTGGNKTSVEDLQPGIKVNATLKDAFTEETSFYDSNANQWDAHHFYGARSAFYHPIAYEIRATLHNNA